MAPQDLHLEPPHDTLEKPPPLVAPETVDEQLFEFDNFNVLVLDATPEKSSRHHFHVRVETPDEEYNTDIEGPLVSREGLILDPDQPAPDLWGPPPPPLSAFVEAAYKILTDFRKLMDLGPQAFVRQVVMYQDRIYDREVLDRKGKDAEDLMPFIAGIGEPELDAAIAELKRGLEVFPRR